ncbi:MAG TPA: arylamine N-acetyltransferase [Chryseosolibacter sp.]|nr:arylamine N-acetyltransferase [Chryseosolibacter sp.]
MAASIAEKEEQGIGNDRVLDVSDYFKRISYQGDRTPTLKTLQAIHQLHPAHIPFENLNPFLRMPVKLDLPALLQKILKEKRGGYCFEHNLLFKAVLESLGFKVKGLAARVLWNQPAEAITARGHMLLLIEIDAVPYIADVGFGGQTLTAPLVLKTGLEQQTPHEVFRLTEVQDNYRLETLVRGEWRPLYRFGLEEQFQVDYEVTSWYLSNNPNSHFVTGLIAARTVPNRRFTLRNNELAIHHLGGETIRKVIRQADDLGNILAETFGISLPETPALYPSLKKIVEAG